MSDKILSTLKTKGPWLSMGDLAKFTGIPKEDLKEELLSLIDKGEVQKIGKKRGTKYGLASAEPPDVFDPENVEEAIIKAMEELHCRVSRKDLCDKLKTNDAKIKPHLFKLIEKGLIVDNGKKRGQLFWLSRHEKEGRIPSTSIDGPEIKDLNELIKSSISQLPLNSSMDMAELCKFINTFARHSFNSYQISKRLTEMIKSEKLKRLKYERKFVNGYRLFFWVEG